MRKFFRNIGWLLLKILIWAMCAAGIVYLAYKYLFVKPEIPVLTKVSVPILLLLFVISVALLPKIREKVKMRQQSYDTAKVTNQTSIYNLIVAFFLNIIEIYLPLILLATLFVLGGIHLKTFGMWIFYSVLILIIPIAMQLIISITEYTTKKKDQKEAEEKSQNKLVEKINKKEWK